MTNKQTVYSNWFERQIVDSLNHLLGFQSKERTEERVRYVMDTEELTEEELLCFETFLKVFDKIRKEAGQNDAKIIESELLLLPVCAYNKTFEKYGWKYAELAIQERTQLPEGTVGMYYGISETLSSISDFFYFVDRWLRIERKTIVKEDSVLVDLSPMGNEDTPQEETGEEDFEFEFTPIQ